MNNPIFARAKNERVAWESQAVWYRIRYTDPIPVRKCLVWLAVAQTLGRVALWHQVLPDSTSLTIGLPAQAASVISRMAHDYAFTLQAKLERVALPPPVKLRPVAEAEDFPWGTSFVAYLVGPRPFVGLLTQEKERGHYWPVASKKVQKPAQSAWTLPAPGRGLCQNPIWPAVNGAAAALAAPPVADRHWLLGLGQDGTPYQAGGQINIYGDSEETANWLAQMAYHQIQRQPGNLIIIDGHGNLVPQLKRKNSVLRLIGTHLHYMDMNNDLIANGFNPLAAVPGETDDQIVSRWQTWFGQMGVHRDNLPVLAEAFAQGIREMADLITWLSVPAQQVREAETASLRHRLQAFLESRVIREWVDWPDNPFRLLPEGGLLFACKYTGWDRLQMISSILLGALNSPHARLILHGIPWQALRLDLPLDHPIMLSNGPTFPNGKTILVRCHKAAAADLLATRFFPEDGQMQENVHLLQRGESIVIHRGQPLYTSWKE